MPRSKPDHWWQLPRHQGNLDQFQELFCFESQKSRQMQNPSTLFPTHPHVIRQNRTAKTSRFEAVHEHQRLARQRTVKICSFVFELNFLGFYFFLIYGFVFLFKTLRSQFMWFLVFNLDANMVFFNVKIKFIIIIILIVLSAI